MKSSCNVAILMSNGFDEAQFLAVQRKLVDMAVTVKVISSNQGLVNGWAGQGWGHNYAVDAPINTALGVDYDMLVIPGGSRSHDKLKLTAHTTRFVKSVMMSQKPVIAMADAVDLLRDIGQLGTQQIAETENQDVVQDGNLLTGAWQPEQYEAFFTAMAEMAQQATTANNMAQAA